MKASTNNIDQLKSEWAKLSNEGLKQKLTSADIEEITRMKSKSEIEIIKRKFIIENLIQLLLLILFILFMNSWGSRLEAMIFNILFGAVIITILIPMLQLLKIGKLKNQAISFYLNKTVPILKNLLKSITILSIAMLPIGFLCGLVVGLMHKSGKTEFTEIWTMLCTIRSISIGLGTLILSSLGGYFLVKFYYRIIYQKHIDNLEKLLTDLNKTEKINDEYL